jgi:hypothetical protein
MCSGAGKPVSEGFSYPASMVTEVAKPINATSLSGHVVYGTGQALSDALVEVIRTDQTRLFAVLTDEESRFCFATMRHGKYKLRISKSGFNTLIVPFTVTAHSKNKSAAIQLQVSN